MSSIQTVSKQLSFNSRLFKNVLEGINDEESNYRITNKINHLRWIAGHITLSRYRNTVRAGLQSPPHPHIDLFIKKDTPPPNAIPLDVNVVYPTLAETMHLWDVYTEILDREIPKLNDATLATETPFNTPMGGNTVLDVLTFSAAHEQYHIGQMSIIRRALDHSAMSFM